MTKTGRCTRAATVLMLIGGISSPAAAQRAAGDDEPLINSAAPDEGGFGSILGAGAGALVRGLRIEGRLRTLYESNIRRLGEGFRGSDDKLSDFRFSPSVVVSNALPLGRQQLYIEGEYGRDFYARNTQLNRNRYAITGGVNAQIGNSCTAALNGSFRRRQSLLSDASIEDSNVIETTNIAASANCQRAVGIGFGVSASHNERDNKDFQRELFDSRTDTIGANISYSLPVLGRFSIGGNYSDVDYPSRTTFVGNAQSPTVSGDGVGIYSVNAGYRRSVGTRLTVDLGGSYYIAKPKPKNVLLQPLAPLPLFIPSERDDFSGAGYNVGIFYRPSPRLNAQFRAGRDISQSSSVGALFVVRDSFGADVSYNLGPSISTGVGATYDIRRYRNAFASIEERFPRVRDNIGRVFARVTYAPRRLFDLDFEVAHQRRNSNPSVYDYSSTSAALTLRVKFGRG